jgi:hypothetical protein
VDAPDSSDRTRVGEDRFANVCDPPLFEHRIDRVEARAFEAQVNLLPVLQAEVVHEDSDVMLVSRD